MNARDNITLAVLTPQGTLFEGLVEKVDLPGGMGRFMVLRNHAPIISSLVQGEVVFYAGGNEEKVRILGGFVEVNDNKVTVCAEV